MGGRSKQACMVVRECSEGLQGTEVDATWSGSKHGPHLPCLPVLPGGAGDQRPAAEAAGPCSFRATAVMAMHWRCSSNQQLTARYPEGVSMCVSCPGTAPHCVTLQPPSHQHSPSAVRLSDHADPRKPDAIAICGRIEGRRQPTAPLRSSQSPVAQDSHRDQGDGGSAEETASHHSRQDALPA